MIKSLLNGTDHYCVFNIQPTAVLQMHLLVFLRIQPCLFETEIGVKILSCINLDFDRVTHFSWLCTYLDQMWGGEKCAGRLSRGQDSDELGVYWLQPYCSTRFHLPLARRQTASEIWLASIIKSDIFIPPVLGTASEHLAALMPGKAWSFDR